MPRDKPGAKSRPPAMVGEMYVGQLPDSWTCIPVVIEADPLCSEEQWVELGRPLVAIRYALGYGGDLYGVTYCHTWLRPDTRIAARCFTPSNCAGIEVGLITEAGDYWQPARIRREGDTEAAREHVRKWTGQDQPTYYWDHSLTMEGAARYLDADGRSVREPQTQVGQTDKSPGQVIGRPGDPDIGRLIDDGGIVADGDGENE